MTYTASITSQGQVTIPKTLRIQLGIKQPSKVIVSKKGKTIQILPIPDFFELYGAIKKHPKGSINFIKTRKSFIQALAENAAREGL